MSYSRPQARCANCGETALASGPFRDSKAAMSSATPLEDPYPGGARLRTANTDLLADVRVECGTDPSVGQEESRFGHSNAGRGSV